MIGCSKCTVNWKRCWKSRCGPYTLPLSLRGRVREIRKVSVRIGSCGDLSLWTPVTTSCISTLRSPGVSSCLSSLWALGVNSCVSSLRTSGVISCVPVYEHPVYLCVFQFTNTRYNFVCSSLRTSGAPSRVSSSYEEDIRRVCIILYCKIKFVFFFGTVCNLYILSIWLPLNDKKSRTR